MVKISVRVPNKQAKPSNFLRTTRPGISWPAIPNEKSSQLLALLLQLEKSQWWPAQKLRRAQFAQALNLLHHARKTVPYYQESLAFLDGVLELTEEIWQQLPVITRQDLQQFDEQLLSISIPPSHGAVSEIRTSGSTGRPVKVKRTETFLQFHHVFTLR